MTPTEKLIADAANKNMAIKGTGNPTYEIRRRGSDRPVICYLKDNGTFDWAFQVPALKGSASKTIRTIKSVRLILGL